MGQHDYVISFIFASVLAGVPLLFGTLGEIITEKAGHLNLGVEGMMYMGAICGFVAGYHTQSPFLLLLCSFLGGAAGALVYAFLTVTLFANQNVTGLALTIFGAGFANYIGEALIMKAPNRAAVLSDNITRFFGGIYIPVLSDMPVLGRLVFQYNIFVYFGVLLAILGGIYLNRTRRGLNLRAVGENTAAADAAGIRVVLYKYIHIVTGGGICGLGGAYIAVVICGGTWTNNCVNGLGWIAVALVIFAGWSPYRTILGSFVFGSLDVLRFYIPKDVINIPTAFFAMVPFAVTAAVIVITSIRKSAVNAQPRCIGINYFREER
ncbi:MAG: Branched-chain amino acid transport system / permease component [Firmicutes bacterium ADurb.Bin193]|nr:MAG: Branched-chain amino acid transport system / permease component [Firmicutes bacterium ADurb.Bin193]